MYLGYKMGFRKVLTEAHLFFDHFRGLDTHKRVLGCLVGVWKVSWGCLNVNSRCSEGVCTQLVVWRV